MAFRLKKYLLLSVLLAAQWAGFAQASADFEIRKRFVRNARLEAGELLLDAFINAEGNQKAQKAYAHLKQYLSRPVLHFLPPGEEFKYCQAKPKVAAYFDGATQSIRICSSYLANAEKDRADLLGTIIHEAAHATGVDFMLDKDRECGAELSAVSAFTHAGRDSNPLMYSAYIISGRCPILPGDKIVDSNGQ